MAREKHFARKPFEINSTIENRLNGGDEAAVARIDPGHPNWTPTALSAGDVAFTAFQSDNAGGAGGDYFQFILLKAVGSGTTIYFTENGYRTDTSTYRTNENVVRWIAQSDLPAGTVLSFTATAGGTVPSTAEWTGITSTTGATTATAGFALANGGDNITAIVSPSFGGSEALTGTAIAAITFAGATFSATFTNASGNATTALPPGLTDGVNAVSIPPIDNGRYTGTTSGTAAQLLAALNTDSNWTTNNNVLSPFAAGPFTLQNQTLAINDVTLAEGNVGTTSFTFTVTRSGGSAGAVSATWTLTLSGTANAADFNPASQSGTVSFADTETSKTITIFVQGDLLVESNESFTVVLSAPTGGATLADATGQGTITNDDNAPPAITGLEGDSVIWTEDSFGPVILDANALLTVTDADSADFNGGTLTVSVSQGGVASEDVLSLANQSGVIELVNGNVLHNGIAIGTWTGGTNGAALVFTFKRGLDADRHHRADAQPHLPQ